MTVTHPTDHASPGKRPTQGEYLAFIPARGGSKGIPRKNITDLCGKPLIAYSILAALHSRHITRVIVSTDDPEIAAIAREYGAETPFLRPAHLAGDTASLADVQAHAMTELKKDGYIPKAVVSLLPTSPFRNPWLVNLALEKIMLGHSEFLTARPVELAPWRFCTNPNEGPLAPVFDIRHCTLSHSTAFKPYGLIHAWNHSPEKTLGCYIHLLDDVEDMAFLIDIDTPYDLAVATNVIQMNLFDFGLN